MDSSGFTSSSFPRHDVSSRVKSDKKWGLQAARATLYYSTNSTSPTLFWGDRDLYAKYLAYSFGDNSAEIYKPALHITPANQSHSFLGGIRWQIKNFATKRVVATISRVFNRKYDPVATAIDPTSSDRRESFRASVQTWAKEQEWLQERQAMVGVDLLPDGVDISGLPDNDEDLQIFMQDYKLNNEITTELGIRYHLNRLDFDGIKEKIDQYLTILPVAGVWCGLDVNQMPVVKVLNPSRILAPRSEFNDYKRIAYAGYVDDVTIAEFRQMIGREYSEQEISQMVEMYAKKGDYHNQYYGVDPQTDRDVDTIQIVHFEIPTVDEYVYLSRKDKYGNDRFVEKPYNYYRGGTDEHGNPNPGPEDFRTKYKTSRKIYRPKKQTVYGGYWIVGSEIIFGYGEKNYCKGELGYKLRAANMLSGRSSCLLKQMIPSLDLLETYQFKIQQLVASATPRIIKIDLFALRKASFKMGSKDMQTADLIDMFFQSGILVTDTSDLSGNSGDSRKPIEVFPGGIADDVVKYVSLMQTELEHLDESIGYNRVSSGAPVSPEIGKGVAQQQSDATDINLDHLYRADKGLCKEIYAAIGHLHRMSVMAHPEIYVPILGEEAVAKILASAPFDEIGIDVEARPTAEEWKNFYLEINEMVSTLLIQPEDRVALRRFESLKQAEAYLKVVTRKRKKEKLQEQQMLIQQNGQVQQQSNDQTARNALALEQQKLQAEIQKNALNMARDKQLHRFKLEEIALMNQGKIADTSVDGEYQLAAVKARPAATK